MKIPHRKKEEFSELKIKKEEKEEPQEACNSLPFLHKDNKKLDTSS